jgi:hypothetical protein
VPAGRTDNSTQAVSILIGTTGRAEEDAMERSDPEGTVTRLFQPNAVVPAAAAREISTGIAAHSVYDNGLWLTEPSCWVRYDRPWSGSREQRRTTRLGTVRIAYGTPAKYEITICQVGVTQAGSEAGITVQSLLDEALAFGSLSLAQCSRAALSTPPKPFRF